MIRSPSPDPGEGTSASGRPMTLPDEAADLGACLHMENEGVFFEHPYCRSRTQIQDTMGNWHLIVSIKRICL